MKCIQIYGFAYGSGNAAGALWRIKTVSCCYQVFPNNFESYKQMILHDQPQYILGLGTSFNISQDKIQIETICTNIFKGEFAEGMNLQQTDIQPFIKSSSLAEYGHIDEDNYPNYINWNLVHLIKNNQLQSKYSFLRIPRNMPMWQAVKAIDQLLIKSIGDVLII